MNHKKQRSLTSTLLAVLAIFAMSAAVLPLTGCEKKGPLEKAGEKLDDAIDDIGDGIEDATDDIGDGIDDAADDVEDVLDGDGE